MEIDIVKLHDDMTTPHYAHEGDAGVDLRSAASTTIEPGEQDLIPTGIKMAIPQGYVGLIWDKSGYAAKKGIHVLAGVIDSTFRGEVHVVVKNLGKENFVIEKDMKIAQILFQPVMQAKFNLKDNLEDTRRGTGGFGSTGKK